MLLSTLTANLQSSYAEIQSQIEALQEQQRLIQAQLQRVGSVESKMESAAALVAEAIAEIKEVCPSELSGYEVTIASLFQTPVAQIEAGEDVATEPEPQEDSVSPSDSAALASPRASDESQILDVESTSVEEVEVDEEAIPETTDQVQAPSHQASAKSLHKQPTKPLQWLATKRGIDTSNMKRHEIASALLGQVTQDELQEAVEQTTKVTG